MWSLSQSEIDGWENLEERAVEPNAYLSPHFVIPAARYLTPQSPPLIAVAERQGPTGSVVVGIAVIQKASPSAIVPRFATYRPVHSFLSGLLLDRDAFEDVLTAMLAAFARLDARCWTLDIPLVWADGMLIRSASSLIRHVTRHQAHIRLIPRAVLDPSKGEELLRHPDIAKRLRDIDRRMRRLRERGIVEWRYHWKEGIPDTVIEHFLTLEHAGWKGAGGSSLRSRDAEEAFFWDMVGRFGRARRAFFSELTLDGEPIASTCNFISGRVGFAFKIGWHPDYADFSPGLLNEVEFMRAAPKNFAELELIDSGASPDSFINKLWLSRRFLTTLVIPMNRRGGSMLLAIGTLRQMKRIARQVCRLDRAY